MNIAYGKFANVTVLACCLTQSMSALHKMDTVNLESLLFRFWVLRLQTLLSQICAKQAVEYVSIWISGILCQICWRSVLSPISNMSALDADDLDSHDMLLSQRTCLHDECSDSVFCEY